VVLLEVVVVVVMVKIRQFLYRLRQALRLRLPQLQDNRHVKVVSSSVLCAGRLYATGNIPGTHSCGKPLKLSGYSVSRLGLESGTLRTK
jgi:hypothetical protein